MGNAGGVGVLSGLLCLLLAYVKTDPDHWLQEDDGGLAVYPGGWVHLVCARGEDGEFPPLSKRDLCGGCGRDGTADGGESVCGDPGAGELCSGAAYAGAGAEFAGRHD